MKASENVKKRPLTKAFSSCLQRKIQRLDNGAEGVRQCLLQNVGIHDNARDRLGIQHRCLIAAVGTRVAGPYNQQREGVVSKRRE